MNYFRVLLLFLYALHLVPVLTRYVVKKGPWIILMAKRLQINRLLRARQDMHHHHSDNTHFFSEICQFTMIIHHGRFHFLVDKGSDSIGGGITYIEFISP